MHLLGWTAFLSHPHPARDRVFFSSFLFPPSADTSLIRYAAEPYSLCLLHPSYGPQRLWSRGSVLVSVKKVMRQRLTARLLVTRMKVIGDKILEMSRRAWTVAEPVGRLSATALPCWNRICGNSQLQATELGLHHTGMLYLHLITSRDVDWAILKVWDTICLYLC